MVTAYERPLNVHRSDDGHKSRGQCKEESSQLIKWSTVPHTLITVLYARLGRNIAYTLVLLIQFGNSQRSGGLHLRVLCMSSSFGSIPTT